MASPAPSSVARESDNYDTQLRVFDQLWFLYSKRFSAEINHNPRKLSLAILGVLFGSIDFKLSTDSENSQFVTKMETMSWAKANDSKVSLNFECKKKRIRFNVSQSVKAYNTATDAKYIFEISKYWPKTNGDETWVGNQGNLGTVTVAKSELKDTDTTYIARRFLDVLATRDDADNDAEPDLLNNIDLLDNQDDSDDGTEPDLLDNIDLFDNQDDSDDETESQRRFG